jgi:predicted aminopeptidase
MLTEEPVRPTRRHVALLACLAPAMLSGCYTFQAARGEMQVLHARRPIEQVIGDAQTPQEVRATLTEVSAARDFAARELGLPDNRSYRTYSDIGRPYVVWNVVAAPEFSVHPRQWCFPVAGCVAYRGYFHEQKAREFAAHLAVGGDDVAIGGVPAYSTLGRFADPVLNTMLVYGRVELAAIIFHELAHQLIYVKNDSAFNEAFATAVEEEGLDRWLGSQGRSEEMRRYRAASARQLEYVGLFRQARADLAELYASGLDRASMRERKQQRFQALTAEMRALEQREHSPSPYEAWLDSGLNNADLASVATYYDCVPGFKRMLREANGDLPRFYAAVRELGKRPRAERDARVCAGSVSAAPDND